MKEYITPELELIRFSAQEAICASKPELGDNDLPIVPFGGTKKQAIDPFE